MESILNIVFNAENVRMLVLLAFGSCFFIWIKISLDKKIDELRVDMNGRINELRTDVNGRIDELKYNDIAHLNSAIEALKKTIEALTFTLEKNGSLTREDKEFVDSRLTTV